MGHGARAVGAVTIGDLAIIGASSIVTRDTHSNNASVGIPGRIISEQNLRRNEAP
jgi:serine acetyltransferase